MRLGAATAAAMEMAIAMALARTMATAAILAVVLLSWPSLVPFPWPFHVSAPFSSYHRPNSTPVSILTPMGNGAWALALGQLYGAGQWSRVIRPPSFVALVLRRRRKIGKTPKIVREKKFDERPKKKVIPVVSKGLNLNITTFCIRIVVIFKLNPFETTGITFFFF